MSRYSQGDFSYSSPSKMTFPKPSASWSVSLISFFQSSKWNKAGSRCLSEGVRCWLKWHWSHCGGIFRWVHIRELHRWCNRVRQDSQEGKGDGDLFPFPPEIGPGPGTVPLACQIPGLRVIIKLERSRTGWWPEVPFFRRQPQQKYSPVTWWKVSASKSSTCVSEGAAQGTASRKFSIQPSLTDCPYLSVPPTVNFILVKAESFVK